MTEGPASAGEDPASVNEESEEDKEDGENDAADSANEEDGLANGAGEPATGVPRSAERSAPGVQEGRKAGSPACGAKATRVAAISPDASISPAAASTSAAAWDARHGGVSPQAGQRVTPWPTVCASIISRAVRARTLSGLT